MAIALVVAALLAVLCPAAQAANALPTPGPASLTIVLEAERMLPAFTFEGCGPSACSTFTLDDATSTDTPNQITALNVPYGTYTITQSAIPNWNLTYIDCGMGEHTSLTDRRTTVSLGQYSGHVTCTFRDQTQVITVSQDTQPNDPIDLTFTGCGGSGCGSFTLDDDDDPTNPNSIRASGIAPGTYTITQSPNAAWPMTYLSCDSTEVIDQTARTATITIPPNFYVHCTFTNRTQSLSIVENTVPDSGHDLSFQGCQGAGCGTFTLDDDTDATLPNSITADHLVPGTYTITQAPDAAWLATAIRCDNNSEPVNLATRTVTVTLTAGESQTCVFTNATQSITVVEDALPDDAQDFSFTGCRGPDCAPFSLDDDTDTTLPRSARTTELPVGTYTITQDQVPGYELTGLTCGPETVSLANRRATINLSAGEQVTCTFSNRRTPPPLTGVAQTSAGTDHTCARLENGEARCWGSNSYGQLGDGTVVSTTRPVVVTNRDDTGR